jgi:hypothetical protein
VFADLAGAGEAVLLEKLGRRAEEEAALRLAAGGHLGDRLDKPAAKMGDLVERAFQRRPRDAVTAVPAVVNADLSPTARALRGPRAAAGPARHHRRPARGAAGRDRTGRAPQIGTELTVEVPYKQQEIVSSVDILTKFEGTATVTGTYQGQQVTGHAFLEFVGNWS